MRRRLFLDQRRPSFKRRWQQRPWWVLLLLSLLALSCVLLLAVLLGSPDPDTSPSTSATSFGSEATSSPLLSQVIPDLGTAWCLPPGPADESAVR
jgi:alpha-1,4-galacturonosyltransferase